MDKKVLEKKVEIGGKYTIVYDAADNDRPLYIERNGQYWADWLDLFRHAGSNLCLAMFHELVERDRNASNLENRT